MLTECVVIIDIGGTTYSACFMEVNSFNRIYSIESRSSFESVSSFVERVVSQIPTSCHLLHKIVGLPGDIDNNQNSDYLFCPPLGYSVNINELKNKGWSIVNDTIANAFFSVPSNLRFDDKPIYLVTLGTSLGFSHINSPSRHFNFDFSTTKSFEIAHNKVSDYDFLANKLSIFPFQQKPEYIHQLFSVGGLANCLGISTTRSQSDLIFRGSTHKIIENLFQSNQPELFIEWSKLFHLFVSYNVEAKNKFQLPTVVLAGGLCSALKSHKFMAIFDRFR